MPVIGSRVPVKLPFRGATDNTAQYVSMKAAVAKFLGLKEALSTELEYDAKVNRKDKGDARKKNLVTIKRRRRPGYKQRAIKLTFKTGHKAGGGRPSTIIGQNRTIGKKSFASIQFPVTRSCSINEIVKWFESGAGSKLKVLIVTDMSTGQSYPIAKNLKAAV